MVGITFSPKLPSFVQSTFGLVTGLKPGVMPISVRLPTCWRPPCSATRCAREPTFHLCMARPVEDRKLDVMLEEIFANTRPAMYGFHSQTHSSTPQFTVPYQVWTSSLHIFSAVDCRHHVNLGGTHVTISNPTSVVRHTFGRKVCKGFKFGFKESEEPLLVSSERTTSSASAQSPLQSMLKRRRLTYKQTVGDPHATAETSDEHRVAQCKKAFEMLAARTICHVARLRSQTVRCGDYCRTPFLKLS